MHVLFCTRRMQLRSNLAFVTAASAAQRFRPATACQASNVSGRFVPMHAGICDAIKLHWSSELCSVEPSGQTTAAGRDELSELAAWGLSLRSTSQRQ